MCFDVINENVFKSVNMIMTACVLLNFDFKFIKMVYIDHPFSNLNKEALKNFIDINWVFVTAN